MKILTMNNTNKKNIELAKIEGVILNPGFSLNDVIRFAYTEFKGDTSWDTLDEIEYSKYLELMLSYRRIFNGEYENINGFTFFQPHTLRIDWIEQNVNNLNRHFGSIVVSKLQYEGKDLMNLKKSYLLDVATSYGNVCAMIANKFFKANLNHGVYNRSRSTRKMRTLLRLFEDKLTIEDKSSTLDAHLNELYALKDTYLIDKEEPYSWDEQYTLRELESYIDHIDSEFNVSS